ncbi:MAG: DNA recombination protein RmuC, partial [bacterium]|nr:DNA recombination protein RmuC [bacterium]
METILVLSVLILGFGFLFVFLNKKLEVKQDNTLLEWLKSMDKRLDLQTQKILESQKTIGEMSEIGKSMKDLQNFLASPKLRGGLGEQVLKDLLTESLPRQSFSLQYSFRSGVRVDAMIKTSSGIIPIDSKFSMENFKKMHEDESFKKDFQRDIKNRVDEIADKYILPDEGTVDFALMYVPSEAVYYDIVNSELIDYAYKRRVMPVSPSTFYAFLRSVLLSFEG